MAFVIGPYRRTFWLVAAPYLAMFALFLADVAVLYPQLTLVDLAMRSLGMYALDRTITMATARHEDKVSAAAPRRRRSTRAASP